MKTTVEIADSLVSEAMAQARQRGQTLRQVLDEGLRLVLARERSETSLSVARRLPEPGTDPD